MEANEVGLKLVDTLTADTNDLGKKLDALKLLGYYVDVSTTFVELEGVFDIKYVHESYTLLIYKKWPRLND